MSLIWVPKRRTSQPASSRGVNRSHPAMRGAQLSVNYAQGARNIINGRWPDLQHGVQTPLVAKEGIYDSNFGTGADDRYSLTATNDFAFLAVVDASASAGAYASIMGGDGSGSRAFQFRFNNSNQLEFIRFNTGGTPYFATVAASSRRGAVLGVSIGNSFWVVFDGVVGTAGTITGTPLEATRVAIGNGFGNDPAPSSADTCRIFAAHVLLGSAVKGFEASLVRSPWQLFAPAQQPIYFAASAGGLPTLSAPQMTGITTTGGYPRVSYVY